MIKENGEFELDVSRLFCSSLEFVFQLVETHNNMNSQLDVYDQMSETKSQYFTHFIIPRNAEMNAHQMYPINALNALVIN